MKNTPNQGSIEEGDKGQHGASPQHRGAHITVVVRSFHWFVLGVLTTLLLIGGISACYQGRDIARITGRAVHVELPSDLTGYDQIVSISFHKNSDGETLKDITYLSTDGKLHSKEYNDWGIFQGEIIWELAGR